MVQLPVEARAQGGRAPAGFTINHEGEVEQGVVEHRHQTRQRHLSSGQDEDIASSYFAAQYGAQQKVQQPQQQPGRRGGSRQGSQGGSRRGSVGQQPAASNTGVQSVMANAAAAIAARKKQEQEARQEEARRLLQRREMTPDNLRHVEEKLIELQRQRQQEAAQDRERAAEQAEQGLPPEGSLPPPPPRPEPYRGRGSAQPAPEQQQARAAGGPRTQSVDREAGNGRWAISASTDYLDKKSAGSGLGMVRGSAPLGLAEPSVKRDGYAVGSKEGSMYRSSGNLNVSSGVAGSRAGSESREQPKGSWKERRASTSDIKGAGIRAGGNLAEPSAKPCMPFGSGGGGQVRRQQSGRRQQVTKSSSQQQQSSSRSSSTCRTSTCSTMQQVSTALEQIQVQESRAQVTVALPRGPRSRAQSLPRGQVTNEESSFKVSLPASARTSRQASVEPEGRKKLTRHGSVEIYDGSYNLTMPNKLSRQASQTRLEQTKGDHIKVEAGEEEREPSPVAAPPVQQTYAGPTTVQQTYAGPTTVQQTYAGPTTVEQTYTAPVPAQQTSVQQSVQQSSVQQSSVQQSSVQQTSVQQSVQQTSMHQEETSFQQSTSVQEFSEQSSSQQSSVQQSSVQQQQSSVQQQQSSVQQSSSQQSSVQQSSVQHSSVQHQQSSEQQSSKQLSSTSQSSIQQSSVKQSSVQQSSNQQSSIQQSTKESSVQQSSIQQQACVPEAREAVPQAGGKFNITQGLTRRSRQPSGSQQEKPRSRQPSGPAPAPGPGAALRGLDTALQQIAAQQQKETTGTTYVAKVSSRQSSRHPSGNGDVTCVTLSLPPSQRGSRQTSRRGSVSEGGDRRSRRGSLDIYTAEYALKLGAGKGITAMEQKTAFHMKVENEAESEMTLCGRCHLPTHKTKACPEFGTLHCPRCLDWAHWEDSCWAGQAAQLHPCARCQYEGHTEAVHDTQDNFQRRAVVDALGWEPFQDWFYEPAFRSWWQVTGCVGVPLYRLYPRKTAWRTERPEEPEEAVAKSSIARADSVDDMIAQVKLLSQRRPPPRREESDSSGRSTPAHLREDPSSGRTFSESVKSMEAELEAK